MYILTNASISRLHIGHDRNEWPQGTQVAKWPQGIHANLFSSVKHNTHGFDGASVDWSWSEFPVAVLTGFESVWLLTIGFNEVSVWDDVDSLVDDCDDVVISMSAVLAAGRFTTGAVGSCDGVSERKKISKICFGFWNDFYHFSHEFVSFVCLVLRCFPFYHRYVRFVFEESNKRCINHNQIQNHPLK